MRPPSAGRAPAARSAWRCSTHPPSLRPLPQDAPAPLPARAPATDRELLPPAHPDAPWGAPVRAAEAPAHRPAHLAVGTPRREARRQARYGPPAAGRPALARRNPGAQAVATDVAPLRRSEGGAAGEAPAPRSAEDVHSLIANFAAGVRQGQAQARGRGRREG